MLIHLAVCGIGLGHATRSYAVAEELWRRGHTLTFSSYGQGFEFLSKNGCEPAHVPSVGYGVGVDGAISVKKTIVHNLFLPVKVAAQTLAEASIIGDADVVVSDTRASATLAAKLCRKPVATILNQYNLLLQSEKHQRAAEVIQPMLQTPQLVWNLSDKIIIPDLPPPYTLSEHTLQLPDKLMERVVYTGPLTKPILHSHQQIEDVRSIHGALDKPFVLLVFSGGVEEKKALVEMFKMFGEKLSSDFVYVMSTADPSTETDRRQGPLHMRSWIPDLDLYIEAADLVVCRGGLTLLLKCILYGKPAVVIPPPQHGEQLANAIKAEKMGVAKMVEQRKLSPAGFEEAVKSLLRNVEVAERVKHLSEIAWNCGGVAEAADSVESLY
ncbi:glycosyltransferase family 28 [Candidatus Caldarchaeum subterraneum]|uniref:Glycosyltransferase family 28 n=1 Tax=Caldiarchaeum subterraneum TaxID=311458 RepID=E6N9C2_CALS0|nr:glycosyltransferase family 28 [Candidatus Caldarchaeum subterraneum]BAJ51512.1 glycosyltransferase family 28 [Candidatus Caldarchaeum subterraneum]